MLGRYEEALDILSKEKAVIAAAGDTHRRQRLRALQRGEAFSIGGATIEARGSVPPATGGQGAAGGQQPRRAGALPRGQGPPRGQRPTSKVKAGGGVTVGGVISMVITL